MSTVNIYEITFGVRRDFGVVNRSPLFCRQNLLVMHCCTHILVTINFKNVPSLLVDHEAPIDGLWSVP